MNDMRMTPEEEREFYSRSENQVPQGPARRRGQRMATLAPMGFQPEFQPEALEMQAVKRRSATGG